MFSYFPIKPENLEISLLFRNVRQRRGAGVRTEGNIARLSSNDSDDDETNTWNGNSTQQM